MKKVVLYILGSAFFFSTMEVTLKIAATGLNYIQLTFWRFLLGGIFLLPFAVSDMRKRNIVLTFKDNMYLLFLGIICIPVSMVFFQLGVVYSNASTSAVIFCVNPLFTMLFAHFIINEKMTLSKGIALFIGILGIIFMARPWEMAEGNTAKGLIYIILAAAVFGFYSVMGKKSIAKIGSIPQTSISFIMGSLTLLLADIIFKEPILEGITVSDFPVLMYISIGITGLGYLFYFKAIDKSDAATASIVFFIKPALAPIFAVIILNENIGWTGIAGILLILAGSFINLRSKFMVNKRMRWGNDEAQHK